MYRRTFLGNLLALLGLPFLKVKAQSPALPVVSFDENGCLSNAEALLENIPYSKQQNPNSGRDRRWWKTLGWERERLVWVDERNAVQYVRNCRREDSLSWGEMRLVETIDHDWPADERIDRLDPNLQLLSVWKLHPTENTKTKKPAQPAHNYFGPKKNINELPL